jgi:hypothetical protein
MPDLTLAVSWSSILMWAALFVASFFINLGIVSFILVKLPADHFAKTRKRKFMEGYSPVVRVAAVIGKNIGGVLLVALGVVLSLPGVPGQGLLTILLGVMLVDFPGKHRLEQKLLSRPSIVNAINGLRGRFHKPPLELDGSN